MKYEGTVRGVIRTILKDPDDVNDAVQDTFLAAWEGLDQLADPGAAAGWICSIARNTAVSRLRKKKREKEISLNQPVTGYDRDDDMTLGDLLSAREPGPEELCVIRAELRSWYNAYRMLPEHYRLHLYLRYYMQLGTADINRQMGISEQARKSACCRARKAMRRNFSALEEN